MRADLHMRDRAAQAVTERYRHSTSLSDSVQSLVAVPLVKLAVDSCLLVQACAVHGGDVAPDAGRPHMALELLLLTSASRRSEPVDSTGAGEAGLALVAE